MGDNVHAPHGVLLVLSGGPGQPGLPILRGYVSRALSAERQQYRIVVFDQRGTGAGALDCKAMQHQMGSSDLTPPKASAVRACARKLGTRRQFFGTDDAVADMEDLRQALGVDTWSLDGISYGTYTGERYGLAHPSHVSKLVLDSVVPQVGETDLGVVEFAAVRRVFHSVCGTGCLADIATVVRRDHLGTRLFDALTFDSIADPTYRKYWNVPAALHAARAATESDSTSSSQLRRTTSDTPPPCSTRACTRARSAPTGAIRGATRPRRSPAAPPSSEPRLRGFRPRSSIRSIAGRPRATGSYSNACRGRRRGRRRLPRGKLRVRALLVEGDHDLSTQLTWARQQLALTPHGKLVVVPGGGHSVQSRATSDVGRNAVARFLLGS